MIILLFGFILLFITVLQAFTPKFFKQTEAFGVYVPEQYAMEQTIVSSEKKIYECCSNMSGLIAFAGYIILGINAKSS